MCQVILPFYRLNESIMLLVWHVLFKQEGNTLGDIKLYLTLQISNIKIILTQHLQRCRIFQNRKKIYESIQL